MFRILLLAFVLCSAMPARAQLIISEFMASNTDGIRDADGDQSDWIEIYNTSSTAVNLSGWFLTDKSTNLTEWPLPPQSLAGNAYLIIFASGKDRYTPDIATNFKLAKSGEYLALTEQAAGGGITIATQFSPTYPEQFANISYGLSGNTLVPLVTPGSSAVKVLIPSVANGGSALGTTWTGTAANEPFADGSWQVGTLPVGVAGTATAVGSANLKLRLDATSAANLTFDSSGSGNSGTNTGGNVVWVASSTDTAATPRLRHGLMQFTAVTSSQVTISTSGTTDFDSSKGTICFWMQSSGLTGSGSEGAMLFDRRINGDSGPGEVLVQYANGTIFSQPAGTSQFNSIATVNDNLWHFVAFTYNNAAGGTDTIYVDSVNSGSNTHSAAWAWPTGQTIDLGTSRDPYWYLYNGLLDDVRFYNTELTPTQISQIYEGADENVDPSDVNMSLAGTLPNVNSSAYLRIPFTVADPTAYGAVYLSARAKEGFVAYVNGQQILAENAPASPAWNSTAPEPASPGLLYSAQQTLTTGALRTGTNILAIQGVTSAVSDPNFLVLPTLSGVSTTGIYGYLTTPTPGGPNSTADTTLGPLVSNVTGSSVDLLPAQPTGGAGSAPITINATVTETLKALAASNPVQLAYRVMFGAETVVPMTTAGSGVYTAQIPTTGLSPGQMLRWRVIATDTSGNQATAPPYADPTDADQYYGTVALDNSYTTQLPVYSFFVNGYQLGAQTTVDTDGGAYCDIFYSGELYDNILMYIKGDTSRYLYKRSHHLSFNSGHHFRWDTDNDRLSTITINAEYVDPSYSRQFMELWLHRQTAGSSGAQPHFPVRLQMNSTVEDIGGSLGSFWQLGFETLPADTNLLDALGLDPNGAFYTSVGEMTTGGSGVKKTRLSESNADYMTFAAAMAENNTVPQRTTNIFNQVNLPPVIDYMAVARIAQEADDVWANMDVYRDTDGSGLWRIVPYDENLSWGQLYYGDDPSLNDVVEATQDNNKSHPLYGSSSCMPVYNTGSFNRFYDAIFQVPQTRAMVLRRMRSVMDAYVQPPGTTNGILETQLNAEVTRITQEALMDRTQWGFPPIGGPYGLGINNNGVDPFQISANNPNPNSISEFINNFIIPRRTHLFVTHSVDNTAVAVGITNTSNAGIPDSQPATFPINITGYDSDPAGATNQLGQYIQLTNPNTFDADITGWSISGGTTFTFPAGTVVNAGGSIYVSPNFPAFYNRTVSPAGNQNCYVVGPSTGQLSARGDTIALQNANGNAVASTNTIAAPTAAQQWLRITELNYAPAAPTSAELAVLPGATASDFEFIELTNIGTATLNIGGAQFIEGITFTFPAGFTLAAGARTLVVGNVPAFNVRYPGVTNIAGAFLGNLSNSGEEIEIIDAVGQIILDFTYDPSWFPPSDAGGYTLVASSASPNYATYSSATNWELSGVVGGTPGAADTDFSNVYEGWRWNYFSAAQIALANGPAALTADPANDGLNNLGKYAFGRNPLAPDDSQLTTASVVADTGGNYLAVTFTRRHKAVDLTYVVEASGDLVNWTPVDVQMGTTETLSTSTESVTFRDTTPLGSGPRYLRVSVTKNLNL